MILSQRIQSLTASPIRKLSPYADAAKAAGKKVYHLNIGQPDIATPAQFMDSVREFQAPVIAYSNSKGEMFLLKAVQKYYAEKGMDYAEALAQATEQTKTLDLELYSSSAVLVDVQSGTVLAEKGMDEKIYPASMTKVMTLLVAAENLPDLDATFTMTQAIIDPLYLAGASMAGYVNGETVTMRDLLYGAVVPSGAEATEALAQAVAGSEEAFVAMMNEKAAALGLANTHFMNTSGLHDENHYSTVREISLILQAALENETCTEILSAENYRASETEQHPDGLAMTNKFLYRVHHEYALNGAEITAAKTGYTAEAMNCCASAGKTPDGRSVICVTANAWTGEFCIEDHIALYTKYCGSAEAE